MRVEMKRLVDRLIADPRLQLPPYAYAEARDPYKRDRLGLEEINQQNIGVVRKYLAVMSGSAKDRAKAAENLYR